MKASCGDAFGMTLAAAMVPMPLTPTSRAQANPCAHLSKVFHLNPITQGDDPATSVIQVFVPNFFFAFLEWTLVAFWPSARLLDEGDIGFAFTAHLVEPQPGLLAFCDVPANNFDHED